MASASINTSELTPVQTILDKYKNSDNFLDHAFYIYIVKLISTDSEFRLCFNLEEIDSLNTEDEFEHICIDYLIQRIKYNTLPIGASRLAKDHRRIARHKRTLDDDNQVIFPSMSDSERCVVFVHGLSGHYRDTWGLFPELLANDDMLDDVSFVFWGFPTAFIGRKPGLRKLADTLTSEIRVRFGKKNLLLVGHSLGGLIIKRMLVDDVLRRNASFANCVRGVIFFATPHLGSKLANLGSVLNPQISELRLNDEMLTDLERDWNQNFISEKNPKITIPSTYVAGLEDNVVTSWSATTVVSEYETIKGNHTSLVKPNNETDLAYLLVKDRIRRYLFAQESS